MINQTVDLNENLVKIDNLLKGLEYLYEEITTRKDELVKSANVLEMVKQEMNTDRFNSDIMYYIRNHYGSGLCREVTFLIMDRIDNDIDVYINRRVSHALEKAGVPIKKDEERYDGPGMTASW
jgi:hypothetical protein